MKFINHIIIFATIFTGFYVDGLISATNPRAYYSGLENVPYLIESCIGLLIFCYWVYAMPEKLHSSSAFIYGGLIDLCFGNSLGFHMMFFVFISYVIHVYVFRFRLFSYLQLIIFFAGTAIFYLVCKYLVFSPFNYSYWLLICSFGFNALFGCLFTLACVHLGEVFFNI
tara:strand:- start:546 stop:1052 length:507 start_codon:yes stop_codon:yes gene_type:complete